MRVVFRVDRDARSAALLIGGAQRASKAALEANPLLADALTAEDDR
jgi:hypothetical protein